MALFKGSHVDVPSFIERAGPRFRDTEVYPSCLECGEKVYPKLAEGPRDPLFAHWPNSGRGCGLASSSAARLSAVGSVSLDQAKGAALRKEFIQRQLPQAYALIRNVTARPPPTMDIFERLIRRSDGRGIWAFVGMEGWMLPFILPLLDHFEGVNFRYHFVMRRGAAPASLLGGGRDLTLDRVFSNSGNGAKSGPSITLGAKAPNPLPVSQASLKEFGDASWMREKAPSYRLADRLRPAA